VLIIQGTERAADLIADCLDVSAEMDSVRVAQPPSLTATQHAKAEQWAELRGRIIALLTKPD
jgi:hypothetical protein